MLDMTDGTPTSGPAPIAVDLETDGVTTGTYDGWLDAAAAVLRKMGRLPADPGGDGGGAADRDALQSAVLGRLARTNADGIRVPALGRPGAVALLPEARRGRSTGGWDIRALVAETDPATARATVLGELEGGATSLLLQVGAGGTRPADLAAVLEPVLLDIAAVVLHDPTGATLADAAAALAAVYADRGLTPATGTSLGADPWAVAVRTSSTDAPPPHGSTQDAARITADIASAATALGVGAVVVDGTAAHERGAGDVLEIAWTLAVGAAALRALAAAGPDVGPSATSIGFRYAVTDEQFTSIAKLRAARVAWDRVLELSGVTEPASRVQHQHAVTSRPMMSRYDPWVNMLRGTVAGFAAGVGGAQAVSVLPFDTALGAPDAFGRRIARNVSHLLIGESRVAEVADAAGGAAAVEELTSSLARAAWAAFQHIEAAGGAAAVLADGSFAADCDAQRAVRTDRIATRKIPLTGVSEFPHADEKLPRRRPGPDYRGFSWPAAYEQLRDSPAAAPVFLATLGPAATHSTRAGFAANALAAVGIAVVTAGPTSTTDDALAAYQPDVTGVVCLAGTDADYASRGAETIAALRTAGARHVLLAGTPSSELESLIDDRIALGDDVPALGERLRSHLQPPGTDSTDSTGAL